MIWAALLVTMLILRPSRTSALFWILITPAFIAGGWQMVISRAESRKSVDDWSDWEQRLKSLAVIMDVDDDGHLYEWFDPPQWEAIFRSLEQMPKDSRSLRAAIISVVPDFEDERA
jgi:hypothetical protein